MSQWQRANVSERFFLLQLFAAASRVYCNFIKRAYGIIPISLADMTTPEKNILAESIKFPTVVHIKGMIKIVCFCEKKLTFFQSVLPQLSWFFRRVFREKVTF
jgi:hypothetical protein